MTTYLVVGGGYTGTRVARRLPNAACVGRKNPGIPPENFQQRDLDQAGLGEIAVKRPYRLLYTVPPATDAASDRRLGSFLAALAHAPERIVYLSSSGVYGDQQGQLVDESVTPDPQSARAKRRWDAEQQITNYAVNTGCTAVFLRVPGIYGPGRLGLERIGDSMPVIREQDAHPGNRIHVRDLVQCCLAALQLDDIEGIINVGDGDHRSSTWFTNTVARIAGLPAPPEVTRAEAEETFSRRRLSFLGESRRLDVSRMHDMLGVQLKFANPEDGIRASLGAGKPQA